LRETHSTVKSKVRTRLNVPSSVRNATAAAKRTRKSGRHRRTSGRPTKRNVTGFVAGRRTVDVKNERRTIVVGRRLMVGICLHLLFQEDEATETATSEE
jgi:hypothetical protein